MEKIYNTKSQQETQNLGFLLGKLLTPGDFIALSGPLGAGKTAFSKGVAQGLDIRDDVLSPTFTIINEYKGKYLLAHMDAYRLEGPEEMENTGFDDYLSDYIVLLEWPERVESIVPDDALWISIKITGKNHREIKLSSPDGYFDEILQELDK